MRRILLSFCLVFSMYAHAQACDVVDLAVNFKFGWQESNGQGDASCSPTNHMITCGVWAFPSHNWYVKAISYNWAHQNWGFLRKVFVTFERDDDGAIGRMYTCSDAEMSRAIKHVISCFPPVLGGGRLADGETAVWKEALDVGLTKCGPL